MPKGNYQRRKTIEAVRFFESAVMNAKDDDPEIELELQTLKNNMRVKMLRAVDRAIDILRWGQEGSYTDDEGVRHPVKVTPMQIMAAKALVQFCPKPEQHAPPVTLMFEGIPRPKPKEIEGKVVEVQSTESAASKETPTQTPTSAKIVDPGASSPF
jgi:hypothetical protein